MSEMDKLIMAIVESEDLSSGVKQLCHKTLKDYETTQILEPGVALPLRMIAWDHLAE